MTSIGDEGVASLAQSTAGVLKSLKVLLLNQRIS